MSKDKQQRRQVSLTPEGWERVRMFQEDFQAEYEGITISIGEALAFLVYRGLDDIERGPFVRVDGGGCCGAEHDEGDQ